MSESLERFTHYMHTDYDCTDESYAISNEKHIVIRHLANLKMRCIYSQGKIILELPCLQITLISSCFCSVFSVCQPDDFLHSWPFSFVLRAFSLLFDFSWTKNSLEKKLLNMLELRIAHASSKKNTNKFYKSMK